MRIADIFVGILFIAIGCFSFLASIFNWNWFYSSANASLFIRWLGRKKTRIVYGVVGLIVIGIGVIILSGKMN